MINDQRFQKKRFQMHAFKQFEIKTMHLKKGLSRIAMSLPTQTLIATSTNQGRKSLMKKVRVCTRCIHVRFGKEDAPLMGGLHC